MIERHKAVAEVVVSLRDFNLIVALFFTHPRQSRFRIRLPRVKRVHLVFTAGHFAQIFDTVILLVAIDVVYLLLRPATFTDRPDGMVKGNKNTFLVYFALHA